MKLKLKVVPGASRDRIAGWLGDALKITVRAPPEKGRANTAVIRLLAGELGIAPGRIRIVSGFSGGNKTVEIEGFTEQQLHRIIDGIPSGKA